MRFLTEVAFLVYAKAFTFEAVKGIFEELG